MTVPAAVSAFIAEQRDLLDRLEQFAGTPEYRRLLQAASPLINGELDPWLAEWLTEPAVRLDGLPIPPGFQGTAAGTSRARFRNDPPIYAVARPGGIELMEQYLVYVASFVDC